MMSVIGRSAATMAIMLALTSARSSAREIIDRILAMVSGEIITQTDVLGALALGIVDGAGAADPVAEGLRQLIDRTLILAEVRRFAPPAPDATAIEEQIESMRKRFASGAALAQALATSGISEERLRAFARDNLRITAYLAERFAGSAQPTEEQVAQYVRDHQKELTPNGRELLPIEAQDLGRQRLASQRRQALIAEWTADLRRRADILELYLPR